MLVSDLISKDKSCSFKALESSHSLDIIHNDISKIKVVDRIKTTFGSDYSVLCIGDRGCWPGNDYELLAHKFSLSVDEVSTCADNCYNLSSSGHRGESAFLDYTKALTIHKGFFQLNVKLLEQINMDEKLAQRLLAKVMGWDHVEDARERVLLQALAAFKYDEYQQYLLG
jgi:hypothetical protein